MTVCGCRCSPALQPPLLIQLPQAAAKLKGSSWSDCAWEGAERSPEATASSNSVSCRDMTRNQVSIASRQQASLRKRKCGHWLACWTGCMKAMGHLCVCCKLYNLLSRKWQSGRSLRIYAWRGDASAGANLIAVAVEIAVQIEVAVR